MGHELTSEDISTGLTIPPKDAMKLGTFGDYELYYDPEKDKMIFYTTEYHPGTLCLSKSGLEKMIAIIS